MKQFFITVAMLFGLVVIGLSQTTTYYCAPAPTGNDNNTGTISSPYFTINKAVSNAKAGDIIYLRAGTYNYTSKQAISSKNGTSSAHIVIQSYPGEWAIINGSNITTTDDLIAVSPGSYIDIKSLEIKNSTQAGISLYNANNCIIDNVTVHHSNGTGIYVGASDSEPTSAMNHHNTIKNCTLYNNVLSNYGLNPSGGWNSALTLNTHDNICTGNNVYNNSGEGIGCYGRNNYVANDTVHDNFSVDIYVNQTQGSTLENNTIICQNNTSYYRNGHAAIGIEFANEANSNYLLNTIVRNNVIQNVWRGMVYWQSYNTMTNCSITGNTISHCSDAIIVFDASSFSGTNIGGNTWITDLATRIDIPTNITQNPANTIQGGGGTVAVTGVSVSPATASVVVGATTTLTATVAPSNATNKNVTWTSGNTAIVTVSSAGVVTGVAAGSATITVTTTDGAKTATVAVTVTAASGSLTGTATQSTATVTISTVGTNGWKHFRNNVYKSGSSNSISNYTVVGGTATAYTDDLRGMTWTGGTPTANSTNNKNGWYISGNTKGFSFTAPAGTTNNTLYVYVGGYNSAGKLTAQLSNAAAPNYVYTSSTISGSYDFTFAITYNAGAAGQTINIKWEQFADGGSGNVTLQAAALNGSAARFANTLPAKEIITPKSFSIYPNPIKGSELHLNLNEISGKDDVLISMFDLSGKLMKSQILKAGLYEKNNIILQLNGVSAGAYIVSIQSGNKFFRSTMIKK